MNRMSKDELVEMYKDTPEINPFSTDMHEPNQPINIHEGEFILKNTEHEIKIVGKITFDWFPNSGAHFSGKPQLDTTVLIDIINGSDSFELIIDNLKFGDVFVTYTKFDYSNNTSYLKGTFSSQAVFGDKSIAVKKILFSIPNLREFHGLLVKTVSDKGFSTSRSRIKFEDDNYIITIDKAKDYKHRKSSLEEKGGYIVLYAGELTCKEGSLTHENSREIFHCLSTFLSFLNGRRTSALFIQGIHDEKVIWCDYTNYFVDPNKFVQSWPPRLSNVEFNDLWNNFKSIWQNPDNKDFLTSLIHWYVEANGHTGFSEGSIILAQTALELVYNWWIIEQKGMLLGKDTENISASNKIRLLLSQLNIAFKAPVGFTSLQSFIESTDNVSDAPEAIVYIRNAIVHSQVEKRKKLSQIHDEAKYEALQLFIWYIEMALLRILNFDSYYFNRCSKADYGSKAEMNVPWAEK